MIQPRYTGSMTVHGRVTVDDDTGYETRSAQVFNGLASLVPGRFLFFSPLLVQPQIRERRVREGFQPLKKGDVGEE